MTMFLSQQDDFRHEKPQLQLKIEARGHICAFLPKFHCELNPIEMVWGYSKQCELDGLETLFPMLNQAADFREHADGKMAKARILVPESLK
jgi:hypothetical protein